MKDNNLTHKFWARAVAFCLFCVMTAILACCIAGVVYCYSKVQDRAERDLHHRGRRMGLCHRRHKCHYDRQDGI